MEDNQIIKKKRSLSALEGLDTEIESEINGKESQRSITIEYCSDLLTESLEKYEVVSFC